MSAAQHQASAPVRRVRPVYHAPKLRKESGQHHVTNFTAAASVDVLRLAAFASMVFTGGCLSIANDSSPTVAVRHKRRPSAIGLKQHGHESACVQPTASTVRRVRSEARASRDDPLNFYRPNNLHQRTLPAWRPASIVGAKGIAVIYVRCVPCSVRMASGRTRRHQPVPIVGERV